MTKKVAIITGASRGIGKIVAFDLAKQGYHTVLMARSENALAEIEKQIKESGGSVSSYPLDVSDPNAIENCVANIIDQNGHIDVLFNNAGIIHKGTNEITYTELQEIININLLGAIHMANTVAKQMKKQGSGYIINVSSIAGRDRGTPNFPIIGGYAASKFGLSGYTECLYKELIPHGIRVTAICPSYINTEMTKGARIPAKDMIPAEDIAKTVNYLLSLDSRTYIPEVMVNSTATDIAAGEVLAKRFWL